MPKNELTDMEITEISLVDEPANDDARVVIVKAKSKPPMDEEADPNEAEPDGDGMTPRKKPRSRRARAR